MLIEDAGRVGAMLAAVGDHDHDVLVTHVAGGRCANESGCIDRRDAVASGTALVQPGEVHGPERRFIVSEGIAKDVDLKGTLRRNRSGDEQGDQ